jgi:hypothetical protein
VWHLRIPALIVNCNSHLAAFKNSNWLGVKSQFHTYLAPIWPPSSGVLKSFSKDSNRWTKPPFLTYWFIVDHLGAYEFWGPKEDLQLLEGLEPERQTQNFLPIDSKLTTSGATNSGVPKRICSFLRGSNRRVIPFGSKLTTSEASNSGVPKRICSFLRGSNRWTQPTFLTYWLKVDHLGSHKFWGPKEDLQLLEGLEPARQTKIDDLDPIPGLGEAKYVLRLEEQKYLSYLFVE